MNENEEFEKELSALINYFKLINILKLTYDASIDTFKMLKGDKIVEQLERDLKYFSLKDTNIILTKKLNDKLAIAASPKYSFSPILKQEIENLGWLRDVQDLNPNERFYETIFKECGKDVVLYFVLNTNFPDFLQHKGNEKEELVGKTY